MATTSDTIHVLLYTFLHPHSLQPDSTVTSLSFTFRPCFTLLTSTSSLRRRTPIYTSPASTMRRQCSCFHTHRLATLHRYSSLPRPTWKTSLQPATSPLILIDEHSINTQRHRCPLRLHNASCSWIPSYCTDPGECCRIDPHHSANNVRLGYKVPHIYIYTRPFNVTVPLVAFPHCTTGLFIYLRLHDSLLWPVHSQTDRPNFTPTK